ncbi:putative chitinase [Rhizobium mesoamericanum]|uniref:glycoside hydrolase family 19 protein n=1 Tax=Rhizobium mesoamericanum TaxID=1079800 RepID=UPI0027899EE0|nr:glycoside hydrolase family 19 protein [Rhizobium mesoamericanum]MDQ0558676.1 putative chitinase [Rhizobium mesoamericanum]
MSVQVTAQQLRAAAKGAVNAQNMNSVLVAMNRYGAELGMDRPHRAVQFYAQIMHESGDFRYDREVWGPTAAQNSYDTRADLGNTPALDGDGKIYMGRTAMQITGKANYRAFTDWCQSHAMNSPDFVRNPDAVNTDPWEGLGPLWFWDTNGLNKFADQGDIEMITRRINGGINGLADRVDHYVRLSLVVLGYKPDGIRQFQATSGLAVDGEAGPRTRAELHKALLALSGASTKMAAFSAAPVVEEKTVIPVAVEQTVKKKFNLLGWIGSAFGGGSLSVAAFAGFDWRALLVIIGAAVLLGIGGLLLRHWIIGAIKDIRQAVES